MARPAGRAGPAYAVTVAPGQATYINPQWGPDTGILKPKDSYTVTGTYSYVPEKVTKTTPPQPPDWIGTIETEALELKLDE